MTNTNATHQLILDAEALADAMIAADDFDIFEQIERLSRLLPALAFVALCSRTDVCPTHMIDISICDDDDDAECRRFRNAR